MRKLQLGDRVRVITKQGADIYGTCVGFRVLSDGVMVVPQIEIAGNSYEWNDIEPEDRGIVVKWHRG